MRKLIPVGTFVMVEGCLHCDFFGYVYSAKVDARGDNAYYIDWRSEARRSEYPELFLDPDLSTSEDWHLIWDLPVEHGTHITY